MRIRKAVIPAAGLGTRFLPASKCVPKELITVVDRPVIQYAVEEAVRAGITDICIVTSPGKESVVEHFHPNRALEESLERSGKATLLSLLHDLQALANVESVIQEKALGLGDAVGRAKDYAGNEPFVVMLPDELFDPFTNPLKEMIDVFEDRKSSVVAVTQVPHEDIKAYGSIETDTPGAAIMKVKSVIEKPDPDEAPSDFAMIGRYVLDPGVFDVLENLTPGSGGEIQLADALGIMGGQGNLVAYLCRGRRWDVGTQPGYLEATVAFGAEHPQLGPSFRKYLEDYLRAD